MSEGKYQETDSFIYKKTWTKFSQANHNFRIPVLHYCQKTKINHNASESEPCHNIKYKNARAITKQEHKYII